MGAINISVKTAKQEILDKLEDVSIKLGLTPTDIREMIDEANRLSKKNVCDGPCCTSIFRYERSHQEYLFDEDIIPEEFLAIINGANLFFSIE